MDVGNFDRGMVHRRLQVHESTEAPWPTYAIPQRGLARLHVFFLQKAGYF